VKYQISADRRFESSLPYIAKRLTATNAVQTASEVHVTTETRIDGLLVDSVADVIVADCKAFYIDERIKLPISNPYLKSAFVAALSTFDRETDKIIAKTILEGLIMPDAKAGDSGEICRLSIDSVYEFMLTALKARWDEVCSLANENIRFLVCHRTFMELLRFLISNIDSLCEEAHIVQNGARFEVLGQNMAPIEDIYINGALPTGIQVVNKLVAIAPKRVFLHAQSVPFQKELEDLFGACVRV
jgi:hypothetical protein